MLVKAESLKPGQFFNRGDYLCMTIRSHDDSGSLDTYLSSKVTSRFVLYVYVRGKSSSIGELFLMPLDVEVELVDIP